MQVSLGALFFLVRRYTAVTNNMLLPQDVTSFMNDYLKEKALKDYKWYVTLNLIASIIPAKKPWI